MNFHPLQQAGPRQKIHFEAGRDASAHRERIDGRTGPDGTGTGRDGTDWTGMDWNGMDGMEWMEWIDGSMGQIDMHLVGFDV